MLLIWSVICCRSSENIIFITNVYINLSKKQPLYNLKLGKLKNHRKDIRPNTLFDGTLRLLKSSFSASFSEEF